MNQPQKGIGKDFVAFVIPKECPTVKHVWLSMQSCLCLNHKHEKDSSILDEYQRDRSALSGR